VARSDLILDQSYDETNYAGSKGAFWYSTSDWRYVGQTFRPDLDNIVRVDLYLSRTKVYTAQPISVGIYAVDANRVPTGSALTSTTIGSDTISTTSWGWYTFNLPQASLTIDSEYAIVLSLTQVDSNGSISLGLDNTDPSYEPGRANWVENNDGSWSRGTYDAIFKTYGVPEPGTMLLLAAGGGLTLLRRKRR
jgi:hypothetical protein